MEGALVVRAESKEMTLTVEDIKKYIAPKATDKELFMFIGISKSYGLNPFKREIHFVKYGENPASIIVGYEQYLKRAERTGKLDGWKCWMEDIGKPTEKAIIEIKRKDQATPIKWEVFRNEFDKKQSTWKAMPTFMLKKVAIAQGFRLAFPDELGGMPYIPEEMPQDKGGGTSETLPANVVEAETVSPEPLPAADPEDPLAEGTELRTKINGMIEEAGIDKRDFKAWLHSIKKIGKKFGNPSLSTMSIKDAESMIEKWSATLAKFNAYIDTKNAAN